MLFALSIIAISNDCHARCVTRVGHLTGTYYSAEENPAGTQLTCKGDGTVNCGWSNGDPAQLGEIAVNGLTVTEGQAVQIVLNDIQNGIMSGQVQGDNGIGYFSWYFDANNVLNYSFDDGLSD